MNFIFRQIKSFFISPAGLRYSIKDMFTRKLTDEEWEEAEPRLKRLYTKGIINDKELARKIRSSKFMGW